MNLDPERFWNITPREVKREMSASIYNHIEQRNQQAWLAWHTATLGRMKKPPKLQDLLIAHDEKKAARQPEPWQMSYAKMNVWAMQSKRKH